MRNEKIQKEIEVPGGILKELSPGEGGGGGIERIQE
jgi:hypothetical protein